LVQNGKLSTMHYSRGVFLPSHCLYADDILIFCKGTLKNIDNIMQLFKEYGDFSGQSINASKSKFYFGSIHMSRIVAIASITGFSYGSLPFVYLGIPLFRGKPKTVHLRPIFDKIKAKLGSWKGRMLTIMGRVQLVNVVVSSMLVFSFHVYRWPKSLLASLSKLIRNFVWS